MVSPQTLRDFENWQKNRTALLPNQTTILDAATAYFIQRKNLPPVFYTWTPPDSLIEYNDMLTHLTTNEYNQITSVTQDLLRQNLPKPIAMKEPPGPVTEPDKAPEYPKWWKEERSAPISIYSAGSQEILPKKPGYRHFITAIVLSVSDETDITFTLGSFGNSGAMHFGGDNEPRSAVMSMGDIPTPVGEGPFIISSSGTTTQVGGFVVYSQMLEPKPKRK